MTFTINYTNVVQPDSEAVDRAFYNDRTNDLFLELHGVVYQYSNVLPAHYNNLVNAASVGTYFRNVIRPHYSPARRLGPIAEARLSAVGEATAVQQIHPVVEPEVQLSGVSAPVSVPPVRLNLNKDVTQKTPVHHDDYTFFFTINGNESAGEKEHTVKAKSLDDALEDVFDFAGLLGVELSVKRVLISFV